MLKARCGKRQGTAGSEPFEADTYFLQHRATSSTSRGSVNL